MRLRYVCLLFCIFFVGYMKAGNTKISPDSLMSVMKRVADWQIADYPRHLHKWTHTPVMWTNGVMYFGMAEWASLWKDDSYFEWLKKIAAKERWHPAKGMYFADDICVSQLYCQLYEKYKDPVMLQPTEARLEWVMNHPSKAELTYESPHSHDRWCWCDALFMAPTVYARMGKITGDIRYWNFMEKEFWETVELLYDRKENLFYRDTRYLSMREKNGAPVFWGRGNGWVAGALAVIIDQLPENYPTRLKYITLYQQLMKRVAGLQDDEGYWHASMLDTETYRMPETSSTAFFVYGLAWGIRRGYLPEKKYFPIMEKGWSALVRAVHPDGKLGWVQAIGSDPQRVSADMTEVYGTGAFLLAGTEIYRMLMEK